MADLFEQINNVWEGSDEITTETKPVSTYMTNRFISLDSDGLLPASMLNRLGTMPEWFGLPFLKYATPNKRAPRNAYPKKLVDKMTAKEKDGLRLVCRAFNVSDFHGKQIKKLLEAKGFKFNE